MRNIKVVALVGVLALAVTGFASMAYAADPEGILPDPTEAKPVTFNINGAGGKLETLAGKVVECGGVKGSGEAKKLKLGTIELKFEKCKETVFNSACTTPKQASGVILSKGEFHTWRGLLSKAEVPALVVLLFNGATETPTEFECDAGLVKVKVKGCVAGLVLEPNTLKLAYKVDFLKEAGTTGDPDIPQVKKEGAAGFEACTLGASFNGGAAESSAIIQTAEVKEAKQNGAGVELLLMY